MAFATTDISDAHEAKLHYPDPIFRDFGGRHAFHGPAVTLKTFEDNTKVRSAVETPGHGKVLVVDGGASMRCALFGGNLAKLAAQNGWAGVIVNGCVRDQDELAAEPIGVKALNVHPRKSVKRDLGDMNVPVTFAGVTIVTGNWIYADKDGLLVSDTELAL